MSQRHNTICPETRVNDSPLSAKLKLVSGSAQRYRIGGAHGGLVGYTECWTNASAGIIRTAPPTGRFFRPGIESTPVCGAWWGRINWWLPWNRPQDGSSLPTAAARYPCRSHRPRHSDSNRVGFVVMDRQNIYQWIVRLFIARHCCPVYWFPSIYPFPSSK